MCGRRSFTNEVKAVTAKKTKQTANRDDDHWLRVVAKMIPPAAMTM